MFIKKQNIKWNKSADKTALGKKALLTVFAAMLMVMGLFASPPKAFAQGMPELATISDMNFIGDFANIGDSFIGAGIVNVLQTQPDGIANLANLTTDNVSKFMSGDIAEGMGNMSVASVAQLAAGGDASALKVLGALGNAGALGDIGTLGGLNALGTLAKAGNIDVSSLQGALNLDAFKGILDQATGGNLAGMVSNMGGLQDMMTGSLNLNNLLKSTGLTSGLDGVTNLLAGSLSNMNLGEVLKMGLGSGNMVEQLAGQLGGGMLGKGLSELLKGGFNPETLSNMLQQTLGSSLQNVLQQAMNGTLGNLGNLSQIMNGLGNLNNMLGGALNGMMNNTLGQTLGNALPGATGNNGGTGSMMNILGCTTPGTPPGTPTQPVNPSAECGSKINFKNRDGQNINLDTSNPGAVEQFRQQVMFRSGGGNAECTSQRASDMLRRMVAIQDQLAKMGHSCEKIRFHAFSTNRPPGVNRGASQSLHLTCQAMDFRADGIGTNDLYAAAVRARNADGGNGGIGFYGYSGGSMNGGIHVDTRSGRSDWNWSGRYAGGHRPYPCNPSSC